MNRHRLLAGVLLAGVLLAGFAGNALALTEACTVINNQATLSYSVGGVGQTPILSDDPNVGGATDQTAFTVATKVDLTVTGGSDVHVVPGAQNQVLTYSITNTGNDQQRYSLRLWAAQGTEVASGHTDNFDVATDVEVYTDDDNQYGEGTETGNAHVTIDDSDAPTDGTHIGYTAVVEPGATIYVHVVADIPAGRANGDAAVYALQAVTHQPAGTLGMNATGDGTADGGETDQTYSQNGCGNVIVLADDDGDGSDDFTGTTTLSDAARNGDDYAVGVYYVSSAQISVTKTATPMWDPINYGTNPKPIPGAYVTYTLTITNTGASSATLSSIVDDLQAELDLDLGLFTGGADTDPSNGPYASGPNDSVLITHGGTSDRPDSYGTHFDSGTDQDGVEYTSNPGGILSVYFTDPASEGTVMPAGTWNAKVYTEGELKAGESVAISFNVIIK